MMMAGNCERFSFRTHAQAPARRAAACNLGSSYCETRTTRVPGNRAVISAVARRPSIGFIRQSISTQSGRSAAHTPIASRPSAASQIRLARLSTTCLTIRRIRGSSSAIKILCTAERALSHRAAPSGNPCEHGRRRTCEHGGGQLAFGTRQSLAELRQTELSDCATRPRNAQQDFALDRRGWYQDSKGQEGTRLVGPRRGLVRALICGRRRNGAGCGCRSARVSGRCVGGAYPPCDGCSPEERRFPCWCDPRR